MTQTILTRTFNFENSAVRVAMQGEDPWFVAKDVAAVLGYANANDAISKHVDSEDKGIANCDTLGGKQRLTTINESGLYSLVLSSKMPDAKKFKHWITSEVLPSIRRHGAYLTDQAIERTLTDPDYLIRLATTLKEERAKRMQAEQTIKAQTPKVIWAQAVENSNQNILVGELAKILRQNGEQIGQNRLFRWLRENGYLMKRNGVSNMPTQKAMDLGLFRVVENTITHPDGHSSVSFTPKVTPKGQSYFINKFLAA